MNLGEDRNIQTITYLYSLQKVRTFSGITAWHFGQSDCQKIQPIRIQKWPHSLHTYLICKIPLLGSCKQMALAIDWLALCKWIERQIKIEKCPYLATPNKIGFTYLQVRENAARTCDTTNKSEPSSVCQVGGPAGLLAPFPKSRLEKLQRETGIPGTNNSNNNSNKVGETPGEMAQTRTWPWALSCTQYQTERLPRSMCSKLGHCHFF